MKSILFDNWLFCKNYQSQTFVENNMDNKLNYSNTTIESVDDKALNLAQWQCNNPIAALCIVHGFGEHIGRYHHLAEEMGKHQISTYGIDLRGHGLSEGLKGHARYDLMISDIEEMLKAVRRENLDLPIILFGHSMGGNLILNFMARKSMSELQGFIASSPWLGLAFDPPVWKLKLGNLFAKYFPTFRQANDLDATALSKDPEVVRSYKQDPLVNNQISAGMFHGILDAITYLNAKMDRIQIPGLIYHGTADRIINFHKTEEFAQQLNQHNTRITWKPWEGVYHEPHNDLEKKEILNFLVKWCLGIVGNQVAGLPKK